MKIFFDFETDFVASLRCIPMIVRFKLDTCGVKLKLDHWNSFNQVEKEILINKPCNTEIEVSQYRDIVRELVYNKRGEYPKDLPIENQPPWLNLEEIPINLVEKAKEFNLQITLSQWQILEPLERFILIKLSQPSHENKNFLPALKEFNLIK